MRIKSVITFVIVFVCILCCCVFMRTEMIIITTKIQVFMQFSELFCWTSRFSVKELLLNLLYFAIQLSY